MTSNDKSQAGRPDTKPMPQQAQSALPGKGGLKRIWGAARNSLRGITHGATTEAAIKQELALFCVALPLSVYLAADFWQWLALMGSILMILTAEFLNTAIERLCNHVTPTYDTEIGEIKDLASGGVFFMLVFAAAVWGGIILINSGWLA